MNEKIQEQDFLPEMCIIHKNTNSRNVVNVVISAFEK
jgi:hypothetical protein